MIYGGDLMSNFAGAYQVGDSEMTKSVILSKVAKTIDSEPKVLIKALKDSGISISDKADRKELIDKSVNGLYENKKFRTEISRLLLTGSDKYSNAGGTFMDSLSGLFSGGSGDGTDVGSIGTDAVTKVGEGGATGGVVGAIAGAVDSIFGTVGKFKDAKNQKESDKRALQMQLLADDKKKTNWLPIIIIGGVLTIGGIIAVITLRKRN